VTEAVEKDSKIILTLRSDKALKTPLTVSEKKAGEYFKVALPEESEEDVLFDWWIVNEGLSSL